MYLMHSLLEYLFCGLFVRVPKLKVCFAESQLGLVPYTLDRADYIWDEIVTDGTATVDKKALPEKPSAYFARNCWVCFFRDPVGLRLVDAIGADRILFETDYPHLDTEWPNCLGAAEEMLEDVVPGVAEKIMWQNAAGMFDLDLATLRAAA